MAGAVARILSHAIWQKAFPLESTEDACLVALPFLPGLTACRVVCKGPNPARTCKSSPDQNPVSVGKSCVVATANDCAG